MSDFGQMDPVWKQAGVQESLGLLLSQSKLDPACLLIRCNGMALTVYGAVEWLKLFTVQWNGFNCLRCSEIALTFKLNCLKCSGTALTV